MKIVRIIWCEKSQNYSPARCMSSARNHFNHKAFVTDADSLSLHTSTLSLRCHRANIRLFIHEPWLCSKHGFSQRLTQQLNPSDSWELFNSPTFGKSFHLVLFKSRSLWSPRMHTEKDSLRGTISRRNGCDRMILAAYASALQKCLLFRHPTPVERSKSPKI